MLPFYSRARKTKSFLSRKCLDDFFTDNKSVASVSLNFFRTNDYAAMGDIFLEEEIWHKQKTPEVKWNIRKCRKILLFGFGDLFAKFIGVVLVDNWVESSFGVWNSRLKCSWMEVSRKPIISTCRFRHVRLNGGWQNACDRTEIFRLKFPEEMRQIHAYVYFKTKNGHLWGIRSSQICVRLSTSGLLNPRLGIQWLIAVRIPRCPPGNEMNKQTFGDRSGFWSDWPWPFRAKGAPIM